jgi:selenide,water dikinase
VIDAAVWKLDDERALVVTADFITPWSTTPATGVASRPTNAVSDCYAMGGRPLLALNLVCWNDELPDELLAEGSRGSARRRLEGGLRRRREGHT